MTALSVPTPAEVEEALAESVSGLRWRNPELSASTTATRAQIIVIVSALAGVALVASLWPIPTAVAAVSVAIVLYLANLTDRIWLFSSGMGASPALRVTDDEARAIPDDELPIYTVLVPAFNEPDVVGQLLRNLGDLDYPEDRLDIKLLLEADDDVTVSAAHQAMDELDLPVDVLLVPPADPRTKPKACNFGLHFARGELVTIYDAEDRPEPLQLRRAVAAFRRVLPEVVCIQAKLAYHNDRQNLLTGWFASEYDQWFGYTLPGLMRTRSPIPLGGTSNHLRRELLSSLGGWDPFNVTEDADLGLRLARLGYRTAVLDSVTLEEANSDPINWLRQRSRWYKGYLQTFLVHIRDPARLQRELGWQGMVRLCSVTAGTPVVAVINVLFWGLAMAWELGQPDLIRQIFPAFVFYPAMLSLVLGNTSMMYCGLVAARADAKPRLLLACLTVPLYWVMMSAAAIKAMVQLIFQPSYWEKTVHGLDAHHQP
ncbi:MAG TPA: glycosyltransferase [Acidimicrobiales bacterium]|nr:glycosyltransferase [Acidimicrobiales bacterium]